MKINLIHTYDKTVGSIDMIIICQTNNVIAKRSADIFVINSPYIYIYILTSACPLFVTSKLRSSHKGSTCQQVDQDELGREIFIFVAC